MAGLLTSPDPVESPRSDPVETEPAALTIEAIPGVRELWEHTLGDPDVTIGMVESEPDLGHPCFTGAELTLVEPRWLPRIDPAPPYREHATFVASQLFGQPGSPVRGLAPRCRGLVVPVLRDEATTLDSLNAARAVEALVEAGADIVHFAGASPTLSGDTDDLFKRVITQAARDGVLIIAPAGNEYGQRRAIPAVLPEVLAVGAHDGDGAMLKFSNWGQSYAGHGIVAPGGFLRAARFGGGTVAHKGTSVAAPIVTGVAALLESLRRQRGLPPDPLAVREVLLASAAPCAPDQVHGEPARCLSGKLNVPGALRRVLADARAPESPGVGLSAAELPAMLVYSIGQLSYDFGTEIRLDEFTRAMERLKLGLPSEPRALLRYLAAEPAAAKDLIWTLGQDRGPIYALRPAGAYAGELYALIRRLFAGQLPDEPPPRVERVSVPGRLSGPPVTLRSGQDVPVLEIDHERGLYGWSTDHLVEKVLRMLPDDREAVRGAVRDFLTTVYDKLGNRGARSRNRALNFAATNPLQAARAIAEAVSAGLSLHTVGVAKSPFCRMGSDCQEIRLSFHDPGDEVRSTRVWRFTIDVSDLLPVTLGEIRSWSEV